MDVPVPAAISSTESTPRAGSASAETASRTSAAAIPTTRRKARSLVKQRALGVGIQAQDSCFLLKLHQLGPQRLRRRAAFLLAPAGATRRGAESDFELALDLQLPLKEVLLPLVELLLLFQQLSPPLPLFFKRPLRLLLPPYKVVHIESGVGRMRIGVETRAVWPPTALVRTLGLVFVPEDLDKSVIKNGLGTLVGGVGRVPTVEFDDGQVLVLFQRGLGDLAKLAKKLPNLPLGKVFFGYSLHHDCRSILILDRPFYGKWGSGPLFPAGLARLVTPSLLWRPLDVGWCKITKLLLRGEQEQIRVGRVVG